MAVPTIANTWRVFFEYGIDGWQGGNAFHVQAGLGEDPQDVMQDVTDAWFEAGSFRAFQASSLAYGNISVQPYDGGSAATIAPISSFQGGANNGGGDAEAVAAQVALVITLRTALAGRSNRGRLYLGGLEAAQMDTNGNQWANPSTLQTMAGVFYSAITNGSVTTGLSVYSPTTDSAHGVASVAARGTYLGTIRSRARDLQ